MKVTETLPTCCESIIGDVGVIDGILDRYDPISLQEMKKVRLMNRVDTKYVTTKSVLARLLSMANSEYMVQTIDSRTNMPYYTMYFDTPDCHMYMEHLHGRKRRQKIRVRKYENSGTAFLEIKKKNNKGRTAKKRIEWSGGDDVGYAEFIGSNSAYKFSHLSRRLENRFRRITLVNRQMTERLTIDSDLRFHNIVSGKACSLDDLVIIELKRDGMAASPVTSMLRTLRIHPAKFSKYCIGMALTDDALKKNRFKPRIMMVNRLTRIVTGNESLFVSYT